MGLEVGAEVVAALDHHDAHLLGVDAHHAQQFAVQQLLLAADHGDAHALDLQAGAGAQVDGQAAHHRPGQRAAAVADGQHLVAPAHRRVAGLAGVGRHGGAQSDFDIGADAGFQRGAARRRVEQQAQGDLAREAPARALGQQRVQQAGGVAVAAGAGVVLGVGDDHRQRGRRRQRQGLRHGLARRADVHLPLRRFGRQRIQAFDGRFGPRTMPPDHGRAFVEVAGREAHAEAQDGAEFAVQRVQFGVQVLRRLQPGALRVQRDQEGQPACVQGFALPGPEAARQQRAGAFAGLRHVHVRVGAVGHQRVGLAQHALGHVGVQVQADDDGRLRADQGAQAADQFALAVEGVLGHGRAMQVEVDRVQAAGRGQCGPGVVGDAGRDAFEGVLRDIGRGNCPGPAAGQQRPALGLAEFDEAADRDVDAGQRRLHRRAADEGREGVAAVEGGPVGPARRKGVGLVLVAGDEDAGHGGRVGGWLGGCLAGPSGRAGWTRRIAAAGGDLSHPEKTLPGQTLTRQVYFSLSFTLILP